VTTVVEVVEVVVELVVVVDEVVVVVTRVVVVVVAEVVVVVGGVSRARRLWSTWATSPRVMLPLGSKAARGSPLNRPLY